MKPNHSMAYLACALLLMLPTATPTQAWPTAHCFCVISKDFLLGQQHATGVCEDLREQIGKTYTGPYRETEENQLGCSMLCGDLTKNWVKSQDVANACCSKGFTGLLEIYVWSAVGDGKYRHAKPTDGSDWVKLGILYSKAPVTQTTCHCPHGWISNSPPQIDGGIVTNGQCKRADPHPLSIAPFPPDGTPIGAWGFTWGNGVYAWGNAANGGAPHCTGAGLSKFCRCPAGWASNTSQVDGDYTFDGQCKKQDLNAFSITPLPPNDTQIGAWGFTWGNTIGVWGNAANGGAPICTTQTLDPGACGFM